MLSRNYFYIDKEESFDKEIISCKKKLQKEHAIKTIIGITFFINSFNEADFFKKREKIRNAFGEQFENLPLSIVSQPAGDGTAMEIWTHDNCKNISYKNCWGIDYTVYDDSFGRSVWGLGLSTNNPDVSFRKQTSHSFELMQAILSTEGFTMDNLVRQWNYIPNILKTSIEDERLFQNYQLFNDIRQYYYGVYKRNNVYPAATGIGMETGPVTIDFLAVKENETTVLKGVKNPNQTNAYQYGQEVLIGSPLKVNEIKKAPLFERAKYIGSTTGAIIFISGTASIIGEKTIGLDDISEQINITVNNISDLVNTENLNSMGIHVQERKYSYIRIYVKRLDDIGLVKEFCKKYYGDTPALYVKADVCRDNLLVEIEGEMRLN